MQTILGETQMQKFIQHYILTNFEKSITTIELRQTWENWVQDNYPQDEVNVLLGSMNWSKWMYFSELSPEPLNFTTTEGEDATGIANGFITLNGTGAPENYIDYEDFYSNLKVIFMD